MSIHHTSDGQGFRTVFCNGVELKNVTYADTDRGFARYAPTPLRAKRDGTVYLKKVVGEITVIPTCGHCG